MSDALIEQAERWLEGLLEAVCIVDGPSLTLLDANPAACRLLGRERRALRGQPVTQFWSTPEDHFFWHEVSVGQAESLHSDSLLTTADGGVRRVERQVRRIVMDDGRVCFLLAMLDQTAQHDAEMRLEKILSELRATIESTADGILVTDLNGAIQGFNRRFSLMWQIPDALLVQRDDAAIYQWMRMQVTDDHHYAVRLENLAESPLTEGTDTVTLRDGRVLERVTLPQYGRGQPTGRVFSFRDITERLAADARLHLAATVFESSVDAIFITDTRYRIMAVNQACQNLMGQTTEVLQGQRLDELLFDPEGRVTLDGLLQRLPVLGRWSGELWCRHPRGEPVPLQLSLVYETDVGSAAGPGTLTRTVHCIGVARDLTEQRADKQLIREMAYTDSLTGLPNRLLLSERLDQMIAMSQRAGQGFAVMFVDLDHFKRINDSLGHAYGDRVLVEVAQRIKHCLRVVDTVARQGGDEFVVLLHNSDVHRADQVGQRMLAVLAAPYDLESMSFTVTSSIGVAMFPSDGTCAQDLVKNADAAMYGVKVGGRSGLRFYQSAMNEGVLARMKLDHRMRTALATRQFRLHYQPQIRLADGMLIGTEALIRWTDPQLGDVSPAQFIPVAEDSGFIVTLGDWVLGEAVGQAADWFRRGTPVTVSVNVSALQFRQTMFVERVIQVLEEAGLPANLLELELTESILIGDGNDILARLQRLSALGVRLAIDDFGTGYSSLGYLKRLPIDRLKIDRSFVDQLATDEGDRVITLAVINLAHSLRLRVIAEGVETEVQRQFLLRSGCDEYQGYLCARALSAPEFETLMSGLERLQRE